MPDNAEEQEEVAEVFKHIDIERKVGGFIKITSYRWFCPHCKNTNVEKNPQVETVTCGPCGNKFISTYVG